MDRVRELELQQEERCRHCRRAPMEGACVGVELWVPVCACTDPDFARAHCSCQLAFELSGAADRGDGVCPVCRAPYVSVLVWVAALAGVACAAAGVALGRACALRAASRRALNSYLDNRRALANDIF